MKEECDVNVLLINGSPNEKGCTYTALKEVEKTLNECGIGTELLHIGAGAIQGCTGCGACKGGGECIFDDDNEIRQEEPEGTQGSHEDVRTSF